MNGKVEKDDQDKLSYNIKQIEAFTLGDVESTRKILQSLIDSSRKNLLLFKQYLAQRNYILLAELAHKMLPMFRQLDARETVELLVLIEQKKLIDEQWQPIGNRAYERVTTLIQKIKTDFQLE